MTASEYIVKMAEASSTSQHEVIVECLEFFGLKGTQELTLEQAAEYWELIRRR